MPKAKQLLKVRKRLARDHVESLENTSYEDEDTFVRGVRSTLERETRSEDRGFRSYMVG